MSSVVSAEMPAPLIDGDIEPELGGPDFGGPGLGGPGLGGPGLGGRPELGGREEAPATLVKPVDNAIRIMRYLSQTGKPSTVTLVARELKLNPSTCFNILRTLVWNGMLEFDKATKSYVIGLGAVDLASRALLRGGNVAVVMQPLMDRLAEKYGITLMIWRRIGEDRSMLVAISDNAAAVRIHVRLGQRLPLLIGSAGRLMAAFGGIGEARIRRVFASLRWGRPLPVGEYLAQVREAKAQGWAADDGNFVPGTFTVSAPVFERDGQVRSAISATMFSGQHDEATTAAIIAEIQALAQTYTNTLAGN